MAFIVLPYKPVVSQIYLEPQCTLKVGLYHSACNVDHKGKTLDDVKVQNWSYVPDICWWPLTPAYYLLVIGNLNSYFEQLFLTV